ncbi:MAG: hypothetical protein U0521_13115 [Anaerolineae bacterium]
MLNETNPTSYLPGRTGQVNSQTAFALERFGVDAPALITDVRPRGRPDRVAAVSARGRRRSTPAR